MLVTLSDSKYNKYPNLYNRKHKIDCKYLFIDYPITDMNDVLINHCRILDNITIMIDIEKGTFVNWRLNSNAINTIVTIDAVNKNVLYQLCDNFTFILSQFNGNDNKIDCMLPYTDNNTKIKFTIENKTGKILEFNNDVNTMLLNFKDDLTPIL